jgi:hypothetical protein
MHRGYVKLWRKISEWGWYSDSQTFHIFIHLLINANIEKSYFHNMLIERGQIVIGRKAMSKQLDISEQSIRTSLARLKSTNEITIKPTNKFSIITLLNYESYQGDKRKSNQAVNQQSNQQLTNNQPTTNHNQRIQECKNEKNKEKNMVVVKTPTEQAKIVLEFSQYYERQTKNPYKADRKDYIIIDKLIKSYGISMVREKITILAIYCSGQVEAWFARDGWSDFTIGKLSSNWNNLIPKMTDKQKIDKEREEHELYVQSILNKKS